MLFWLALTKAEDVMPVLKPTDFVGRIVWLGLVRDRSAQLEADRALGLKMKVIAFDPFLSLERAQELGYTGELNGSAEMNIWLHKAVMRELAKNGGVVPVELLD